MGKIFDRIYKEVKKIPQGKVATYGEIAIKAGTTPRVVGFALPQNPDPKNIPCHRVGGMGGITHHQRIAVGCGFDE